MLIKEIMTKKFEAIDAGMTLFEVAKKMRDLNIGTLPIVNSGKTIGLITDRDLVIRAAAEDKDFRTTTARDIMTEDIVFCYDDQEMDDVAHLFEEKKLYRMPVQDHKGQTVGMFSVTDLAQHAPYELTGEVLKTVSQHLH